MRQTTPAAVFVDRYGLDRDDPQCLLTFDSARAVSGKFGVESVCALARKP